MSSIRNVARGQFVMNLLLLLVLQSAPVATGQELIERFHTYDIVRMDVRVEPLRVGARINCDLVLVGKRAAPARFLLTRQIADLVVERNGMPSSARLDGVPIEPLVRIMAPETPSLPGLLTLPAVKAGEKVTYSLSYRWKPGGGMATARSGFVQTHISSFWVPMMADERFDSTIEVLTPHEAIATGTRTKIDGGFRFQSKTPVQALALIVGPFRRYSDGGLEVYLPPHSREDPQQILTDTKAALKLFRGWFGARALKSFRVVIDPVERPMPSYCGGNFVVIAHAARPSATSRTRWLSHISHECAHAWWGHRVGMPILGDGGNWLREGLAQWAGVEAVRVLESEDASQRLWRAHVRAYLSTADLRRDGEVLRANEPTLESATYLDPPRVPYWRGALVLRRIEHRVGKKEFRSRLAKLARDRAAGFVGMREFGERMGAEADVAYYAGTNCLPDFVLDPDGSIRCLDPTWPDGPVPCRVGKTDIVVELRAGRGRLPAGSNNVVIDPERVLLDPVQENNSR